ncbi:MAG: AAA family ATPase [Candidatus Limnocylindria bacterium]
MLCDACGTENRTANRFCDNCGAPLSASCPTCGQPNRPDARFCGTCGHTLSAADAQATITGTTAERRLVSVLFTDLVGFTTVAEDRDPEAVRELLSRYFDTASEIINLHGGTIEKFIGDAVMAVWGTPVAHEDDAERTVRAALELVDAIKELHPDLQARAGVLTGDAAVTLNAQNQGMVAGDLVNTAARLQGVAEPGTVLVGEATMRAAERAIVFESIGEHSLKGKTSPVPAWQALRVVAARGGQGRTDALEAPFVGRDEELRRLKDLLHTVGRERRVQLVSITGVGGIGKSRLVWELEKYVDGVSERIHWHRGRSPSYGEGVTFWALGEMVRRRAQLTEDDDESTTRDRIAAILAEYTSDASERERIGPALLSLLGVEDAPAGGREALFPAWRLFFERIAEKGTTVLVFEDLQWADPGLLDFIDHLLDWARALPIMVVTLARPELFDRRPDWAAGRRQLTAMALEPLADAAMREMLNGLVPGLLPAAIDTIVARAEGVPLYAVETVRGLLADGRIARRGDVYEPAGDLSQLTVPDTLRSLIAARLDALDPADRGLMQDAAVLGQVFSADALAAIHGTAATELDPRLRGLVRRELLDIERDPSSPERGQYKFVQSLIREVAYGTLARRDRRSRHLAVARHYEGVGDDEIAGALASHYLAAHAASDAGAEADAVAVQARLALSAAADRASSLGSPDQAVAFLDQALGITTDPSEQAPMLDRAAASASKAARPDAIGYAEAAVDAFRQLGDEVGVVHASARLGETLLNVGEMSRARAVLEATLPRAEAIDAPPVLAQTLAYLARCHMRSGQDDEAIAVADRALIIAERLNLEEIATEAFINKGSALGAVGRLRESLSLLGTAVERAQASGAVAPEMRARNNLASNLYDADPARATRLILETLDLAREIGDRAHYNWMLGTATIALLDQGRGWDEHIGRIQEAFAGAALRQDRVRMRGMLGWFQAARGDALDTLDHELREIAGDGGDADDEWLVAHVASDAAISRGDLDAGYRWAITAAEMETHRHEALPLAHRAAVWGRDLRRVREISERSQRVPWHGPLPEAHRRAEAAALAALEGRRAEALAAFRESRASLQGMERWFAAARASLEAIILLPDDPEVRSWADDARATFESLRARPYLDRLDEALASAGAPPAPAASSPATSSLAPAE